MVIPARLPLCILPTPIGTLSRVASDFGTEIFIKRDDLTGFAGHGNKGRKLEYLISEIVAQGIDTVVSSGATQSNFLRQLGAACAVVGIRCLAATMHAPYEEADRKATGILTQGGNPALDEIFGLERTLYPDGTWAELDAHAEALADDERAQGAKVHVIPLGGSGPLGVLAFYRAAEELASQLTAPVDFIVCPSSSGSTHIGLTSYFLGTSTKVIGIGCDPEPEMLDDLVDLSQSFSDAYGLAPALTPQQIDLRLNYVGPGYGVPSPEGTEALRYLARREGILLDPIYSAKTFAGMLDLLRRKEIGGRVLFWHTGGMPALFARPSD